MNKQDNYIGFKLSCEPKIELNENGATILDKILCLRVKNSNDFIVKELQKIMKEQGISELYAIDENKVLQLVREHQALEIIKEKIKFEEIKAIPFNNYTEYYVVLNGKEIVFNQEEYDLLKEVFYDKKL